ncbi:putative mitochondrial protein AtMg00820 [Bidens hawaiensis]|uniref:putative mitochondrial protein AtMg00820 n=1 Tax=Bidens hawaiensis TaxID=980011 RepID=UPI004049C388
MVYLVVEEGTKSHRMYDANNKKIVVSRDVKFGEVRNWDWSNYLNEVNDGTPSWVEFFITDNSFQSMEWELHVHNENEDGPAPELNQFKLIKHLQAIVYVTSRKNDVNLVELLLIKEREPVSYLEAVKEKVWRHAMDEEIEAIEKNKTWILTYPPLKCNLIGLKWVYKLKRDATGNITEHKARLVSKGYVQQLGIDFEESFAHVVRIETIRLLLATSAKNGVESLPYGCKSRFSSW